MDASTTTTALFWSRHGEVACAAHAPDPEDPRWTAEGWEVVPSSLGYVKATRYQCEHCAEDGRAVVHQQTPPGTSANR